MGRTGWILAIGIVIALPLLFAAAGGGQAAGLIIGVVLVALGLTVGVVGRRGDGG